MRYGMMLLALAVWTPCSPVDAAQRPPSCGQELAIVTVPRESYAEVTAREFGGRVFLYVPNIGAGGPAGFLQFQLWVVEGVYSRPFVLSSGRFTSADFTRLRQNRNLRSTPISVSRGKGSDLGTFSFGRNAYQVQVLEVTVGKTPSVRARVCR